MQEEEQPTLRFSVVLDWDAEKQVWFTVIPELNEMSVWGKTADEAVANSRVAIMNAIQEAIDKGARINLDETKVELAVLEVPLLSQ